MRKLHLETLEDRCTPALCYWTGAVNNDWTVAGNWSVNREPDATDDVVFRQLPTGGSSPKINTGDIAYCRSLLLENTYNGDEFTIDGTLRISTGDSSSYWSDADQDIVGSGTLRIGNKFNWGRGDISVANVYVCYGGDFRVRDYAGELKSQNVYVGMTDTSNGSSGKMTISYLGMNSNLVLGENTKIWNKPLGTVEFQNSQDSATKGGIAMGTTNSIENEGLVWFRYKDDNGESLHCGIAIRNISADAKLQFGDELNEVNVHFNDSLGGYNSISQTAGTIWIKGGSAIDIDDGMIVGGGQVTTSESESTSINGSITSTGGTWCIGDGDVTMQTLYVNDLSFIGGTLQLAIDGQISNVMDRIIASGNVSINGGTLRINTINGAGVNGKKWDIIQTASNVIGGTDFTYFTWTGMDIEGYDHQKTLNNYRLSKPAFINGLVWNDTNQDGIRQNTETFKPGVAVYLYNSSGTLVASTGTNGYGQYSFNNITFGTYYVMFVVNGMTTPHFSSANQGSDSVDSDVVSLLSSGTNSATGKTSNFTLDGDLTNLDAGVWF